MKGNPRSSGYKRDQDDWYVESAEAANALFEACHFSGSIYDPFCGAGNIVGTAQRFNIPVVGSDIEPRWRYPDRKKLGINIPRMEGYPFFVADFFTSRAPANACWKFDKAGQPGRIMNIVSNPPFKLVDDILPRALQLARHKVAFFLSTRYLEGERWGEDDRCPGQRPIMYQFIDRVTAPPGKKLLSNVKRGSGWNAFAWFVWDREERVSIEVDHIRAEERVSRSRRNTYP